MTNESLEMMKALASLFRKKAAVMQALEGGIAKNGKNTHFDYKFMTASEIKHTVGRLFAQHGISLSMSGIATETTVTTITLKDSKTKDVPILRIQFRISLCDVDTGAVEESFWFGEAGAGDDKAASKCATSALKYFLISNLLIADKEEDKRDTDNQRRRPQEAQNPVQAPQQPSTSAPMQTPVSAPSDAKSTPAANTDWLKEQRFIKWAWDTFRIPGEGLPAAIAKTKKPAISLTKDEAKGAVLASYCDYDSEKVVTVAAEKELSLEVVTYANALSL